MDIIPALLKEIEAEAGTTRKMLQLIPADKFSWKPHEKSMSLQNLAVHIAELPSWVSMAPLLFTAQKQRQAFPYM